MSSKIIKLCFYLLFIITPFIFTKFTSELFEYNKMLFVYALTIIISGTWLIKMVSEKKVIFKRTFLDIPLGLFLLSQVVSTIFSIDPHTSLWGYYSRSNGGLLSIISYITLFYAFVSNITKPDAIKILIGGLIAGGFAALYAIPEHFGVSPSCIILTNEFTASCWVQDVQARVFGTIGQPNWLAAYMAMLIFPGIFFFLTAKKLLSKFLFLSLVILYYLAFTFTYSRGATLGLIAGIIVMAIPILFNSVKSKSHSSLKPFSIIIASLILVNLLFGSALTDFRLLQSPAVPTRPDITTTPQAPSGTQLENGGTESGQIRLIVWKGALDIFKANPLIGSGVETFAYAYYQFRPKDHNFVSEWDFLYNKAHNEYLNYLATTGLFGFLTYMSIILVFLGWVLVLFLKKESKNNEYNLLVFSLAAGYVSYLIQNFFLFSVVIVALLFYLFPALAISITEQSKDLSQNNPLVRLLNSLFSLIGRKKISIKTVQVLITIIILISLNSLYSIWEADTLYKKGSDYNDLGNPGRAYNFLIEAVRLNSKEPLYLSELGNAAASSALAIAPEEASTAAELKDDAVFFTDISLSQSPINTTILRTAIRTYFQLSLLDPSYQQKTMEIIDRAIELAPTDPKLLMNKSVIATQYNQTEIAINSLKKAIDLKPNYLEAKLNLAKLYTQTNQKDLAREQLNDLKKLIPNDPDVIKLEKNLQ